MKHMQRCERVVVTGLGIICSLGHDIETVWNAVLASETAAGPVKIFDASTFPTTFAAEVRDYDFTKFINRPELHGQVRRSPRFAIGAAAQACRQANIDIETSEPTDGIDRMGMGIYLGAGEGPIDHEIFFAALVAGWDSSKQQMDWSKWYKVSSNGLKAELELEQEPNMSAAHLAVLTGARGPARTCCTACASSTQAIGEAMMMIRNGEAEVMITGGAHSMIHPLSMTGFCRLGALSTRNDNPLKASRPFSYGRDGFLLAEGAAVIILESLSSAKRRQASIFAEIIGYGSTSDAFRVTDMHEEGRGAIDAVKAALVDADVSLYDINYINAHGSSTVANDFIETLVTKKVFGHQAKNIPISSSKGSLGHLTAAAGAAEFIICVLAIRDQVIPPTANFVKQDPKLDLDYVPNMSRVATLNMVVNQSFGFGGQNNVLVLKRYCEDT